MKKTIIIIYSVVIAGVGICALAFQGQLYVGVGSLLPAAVLACALIVGLLLGFRVLVLRGNKLKIRTLVVDFDFKYSKNKNGKGSFNMSDRDVKRMSTNDRNSQILSRVLLISAAAAIPFIFLFPIKVKIVASGVLCVVALACVYSINIISTAIEIKREAAENKEKENREQKELEEQKKRETMGYFK